MKYLPIEFLQRIRILLESSVDIKNTTLRDIAKVCRLLRRIRRVELNSDGSIKENDEFPWRFPFYPEDECIYLTCISLIVANMLTYSDNLEDDVRLFNIRQIIESLLLWKDGKPTNTKIYSMIDLIIIWYKDIILNLRKGITELTGDDKEEWDANKDSIKEYFTFKHENEHANAWVDPTASIYAEIKNDVSNSSQLSSINDKHTPVFVKERVKVPRQVTISLGITLRELITIVY